MKGIFLTVDINTVTFPFLKTVAEKERVTEADLYPFVDQYADTQVTDLAFDIFCQISMTPSRVWSDVLDSYHRTLENGVQVDYKELLSHYHRLYEVEGIDPHAVWFKRAREMGFTAWISVRMNDCHCPDDKAVWIRGKEFYEGDEKGFKIGDAYGYHRHCFDYAKKEVRERMLAYIEEQVVRYDADGLLLDFSREWTCFDILKTASPAPIMTEFIARVREILKRAEDKWGHPLLLHIRVMRDIAQNARLGFDLDALYERKLVDSIGVTPRWASCDSDMPIPLFKERYPRIPIYAGITDLTLLSPTDYETAAGYAAAYLSEGADKICLYNFFSNPYAPSEKHARMYRTCGALETLAGVSRRVVVTYQDFAPIGEAYFCPLPAKADGFSLSIPTGPVEMGERVSVILGFDREIDPSALSVKIDGVAAYPAGKTEKARPYAEGKRRVSGNDSAKELYLFTLSEGIKTERALTLSLSAEDTSLCVGYVEFNFCLRAV